MSRKNSAPLSENEELDGMPEPDEVGQAAHNLILAESNLKDAETSLDLARRALVTVMRANDRDSIKIENRLFKRRFYDSKETIVISKAK